jgi:ATP-binding cassette subfamily B protein
VSRKGRDVHGVTGGELSDRQLMRWVLREGRPFAGRLSVGTLLSLASTPVALLQPIPLAIVADHALGDRPVGGWLAAMLPSSIEGSPTRVLAFAAVLQVLVVLASGLQTLLSQYALTSAGEKMSLATKSRLMDHVQRLSFAFLDRTGTADSIYRIQYDASAVRYVLIDSLVPLLSSAVMFFSILVVVLRINTALALVALLVTPVLYLLAARYRTQVRPRYRELKRLESSAQHVVQEALTSFRVVKAFGRENYETSRFVNRASEGVDARLRLTVRESLFGLGVNLTTAAGTALVLLIGGRAVRSGDMTLGELLIVIGYLGQLYGPLQTISKRVGSLQNHLTSAQRVHELLSEVPDVVDRPGARPLARCNGAIEIDDVSFGYGPERTVLDGVSLSVPAGARVGLAGRTGAGKTTLISLITRFYDPSSGVIRLDGVDLRDYRLADLRDQFSIVLQEPVLFSTSIAENIRYARPWAADEQLVAAAQMAGAHDFIAALPNGYDTLVGERGMSLSGGERQRISLARAFLKDAPVLILDEPTSSVDTQTERQIMEAMERLMEGRTAFMIAHRLSTLDSCDIRVEIADGRIVTNVSPGPDGVR